jgi:hypothetical protein
MIRSVLFLSRREMMPKYDNLHQTLRVSFFYVGNICDDYQIQLTVMTTYRIHTNKMNVGT